MQNNKNFTFLIMLTIQTTTAVLKKEDNLVKSSNEITSIKILAKGACRPNLLAKLEYGVSKSRYGHETEISEAQNAQQFSPPSNQGGLVRLPPYGGACKDYKRLEG